MGYKFTMYPRSIQACIKEKHFKLLLSTALTKWAWLQLNQELWPRVPGIPAAGRSYLHSHPAPPAPSSLAQSPCGGASAVEGWCHFLTPISACHAIIHGRQAYTKPELPSCYLSYSRQKGKGFQRWEEKEWNPNNGFSLKDLKFILRSSFGEKLVHLILPQHSD